MSTRRPVRIRTARLRAAVAALRRAASVTVAIAMALPAVAATPGAAKDGAALYGEECGACHIAYSPRLLPQRSWRAVMSGLDRHFGIDAALDPAARQAIGSWLDRRAGPERGHSPQPVLRITDTDWFRHEHAEIGPAVWKRPSVQAPGNCGACHQGAARGSFDESTVRIPR